MSPRLRPPLLGALALAALGCGPQAPPARDPAPPAPALRPVVAETLARLEAEVAALAPPPPEAPDDLEERVAGLLETIAADRDALRGVALEELVGLGDAATPRLAAWLAARERPSAQRRAAAEVLGGIDTPAAAEALLATLEGSRTALEPEPWLYAQCAWQLGKTTQAQVLPRLVLCLKYERDHQTAVWIADSAARFGVLAGLDALFVVQGEAPDEELRGMAVGVLERVRAELGCADWVELARAWREGEAARLPAPPSGPRYALELWRTIAALSEWQLRGVDDARFVLSNLAADAADALGAALSDESVYVRLHAAQCLERMGPRGRAAGEALIARLDDPQVGPDAAAALGALGHAPAVEALLQRLAPGRALDLRVAAARALGVLGEHDPAGVSAALRALLDESEPVDLRAAAAAALVQAAPARTPPAELAQPLRLLVEQLTSVEVEPTAAERALEGWISRRAAAGADGASELLEAWHAVPAQPQGERLAARQQLLRARLSQIGP